jgi:hypothetical protein
MLKMKMNVCATDDRGYFPFVVVRFRSLFIHDLSPNMTFFWILAWVTWSMLLLEQEKISFPVYPSSSQVLVGFVLSEYNVFKVSVPYCDVLYDNHVITMFSSLVFVGGSCLMLFIFIYVYWGPLLNLWLSYE